MKLKMRILQMNPLVDKEEDEEVVEVVMSAVIPKGSLDKLISKTKFWIIPCETK